MGRYKQFLEKQPSPFKVIGKGGFGCVISPAIVFKDSQKVTLANASEFVTKLASDAHEEWINTQEILKIIPNATSLGIFPVDSLHCNIKFDDIANHDETHADVAPTCGSDGLIIRLQGEDT